MIHYKISEAVREHGDDWAYHMMEPCWYKNHDDASTCIARRDFETMRFHMKIRIAIRNFFTEQFAAYQKK